MISPKNAELHLPLCGLSVKLEVYEVISFVSLSSFRLDTKPYTIRNTWVNKTHFTAQPSVEAITTF